MTASPTITRESGGEYYRCLNLTALAVKLGISRGQAERFLARGILAPNGEDHKGCPLFFSGRVDEFRTRIENLEHTTVADA